MKKWSETYIAWLKSHADAKNVTALYAEFEKAFPDFRTTFSGFKNQRYLLGIKAKPAAHHARYVPIGSEHKKKGYWQVKVGDPCIWQQKQDYVYEQYYGIKLEKGTNVVFLDRNTDNFDIKNLYPVKKEVIGILNCSFPMTEGDAEGNLLRIKQAELKYQMHQAGRKAGLVSSCGAFKDKVNERQKRYYRNRTEEQKKHFRQWEKEYYQKKRQDPEWNKKRKKYLHEWYLKHKVKKTSRNRETGKKEVKND